MDVVGGLIVLPLLPAVLLLAVGNQAIRGAIVKVGAAGVAAGSVWLAWRYLSGDGAYFQVEYPGLPAVVLAAEAGITLYLLWACRNITRGEWWIPVLIVVQALVLLWSELGGHVPLAAGALYVNRLSVVMSLIIGIIGGAICVHAISYMADFHRHHGDIVDRRRGFFFLLFVFLGAMHGIVFSNSLPWLHFFWEVTTLCCFELIRYTRTDEAVRNAFRALGLNTIGGLAMAVAVAFLVRLSPVRTVEVSSLIAAGTVAEGAPVWVVVPVALICLAGLSKAAQMPFSSWLLGAMVAPTPVSALLHSSTMVKAGVFVVLLFAPVLKGTVAGHMVALVGGVTFLIGSLIAVTKSNAKLVLAYSTLANLGLVVACAGIGTAEAVSAGFLLVIFHALAKGLLFMAVGTIEHRTGSRDIEDMSGLIASQAPLTVVTVIGILGMFLAPFGMLISKWACLKAFVHASPILVVILAYGSAPTILFWSKWLGKLVSVSRGSKRVLGGVSGNEWFALGLLAAGTVSACALFPLVSRDVIAPYLETLYGEGMGLSYANIRVLAMMLVLLGLTALVFVLRPVKVSPVGVYLGGANIGDRPAFRGALGTVREVGMRNYYLTGWLSERSLTRTGGAGAVLLIAAALIAAGAGK